MLAYMHRVTFCEYLIGIVFSPLSVPFLENIFLVANSGGKSVMNINGIGSFESVVYSSTQTSETRQQQKTSFSSPGPLI